MKQENCRRVWVCSAVLAMALSACSIGETAQAGDDPFALNGRALSTMDFDGLALPTTVDALKARFPDAKLEERPNDKTGMNCYLVSDFPGADTARFYFCDDRLYQFEANYSLERLEQLGGSRALLTRLIESWGPVDHAGERRWTWQRPMYSRRADFYAFPQRAKVTITDTAWTPIVTARRNRTQIEAPNNLGF